MALKIFELASIILSAIIGGMYWGPWLALTRSLRTFEPYVFLVVTKRLSTNMGGLMTYLTPLGILSTLPTLYLSFARHPATFYLTLVGLIFFLIALIVTVGIEVPLVMKIVTWEVTTLPAEWKLIRDKWVSFHIYRVASGVAGLAMLVAGVIFG